jgi:glutamyl/glutaminyl-tRNA synthetase
MRNGDHLTPIVGRLAPTPSGRLHLGNVCAAAAAWLSIRQRDGRLLLRIEDVDQGRARGAIADGLRDDLAWLGLDWDAETPAQSTRDYEPWLARLASQTYRCTCTRAACRSAGGACVGGCRDRALATGAIRLRLPASVEAVEDRALGRYEVDLATRPDPVLRRADGCFTYSLAVVADDIADGVTEVARGADLADQSAVQAVRWRALGAAPPAWLHAPLILGGDGRKLSKSHRSAAVGDLRDAGWSAGDVWRVVLPWLGITPLDEAAGPALLHHARPAFDPARMPRGPFTWVP